MGNATDVVGHTIDGEVYCVDCFAGDEKDAHPIFAISEYENYPPVCDICLQAIEDVSVFVSDSKREEIETYAETRAKGIIWANTGNWKTEEDFFEIVWEAEEHSSCYSPFEFFAQDMNRIPNNMGWEIYENKLEKVFDEEAEKLFPSS